MTNNTRKFNCYIYS